MQKEKEQQMKIEIDYDRLVNGYKPGETVSGSIRLVNPNDKNYRVDVNTVSMKVRGGIYTNSNNSHKGLQNITAKGAANINCVETESTQLEKNKSIDQSTRIPFKFKLEEKTHPYQESYHGMYLSVRYFIVVNFRLTDGRNLNNEIEFFVQVYQAGRSALDGPFEFPKPKNILMTEEKMKFKMRGVFASQICMFGEDFEGMLTIDSTDTPVKVINLQLIRVEGIEAGGEKFLEKTEIQLIEVCDGNITPKLEVPIYMLFPKYHCCPSMRYGGFSVDFEVSLQVVFKGGLSVSCTQPIKILRS